MNHKVYNLLGFAQKSGKIISGETGCEALAKQKKIFLLIIAEDASNNTKTFFKSLSKTYHIKCLEWGLKTHVGISIGKSTRSIIGVLDKHFAEEIGKLIQ